MESHNYPGEKRVDLDLPTQELIGFDGVVGAHGYLLGTYNPMIKGSRLWRTVIWTDKQQLDWRNYNSLLETVTAEAKDKDLMTTKCV